MTRSAARLRPASVAARAVLRFLMDKETMVLLFPHG
jgi:hypothetical protein